MTHAELPDNAHPDATLEVHERAFNYETKYAEMITRLAQDTYEFRLGAETADTPVRDEVEVPFGPSRAARVTSESEGKITVDFLDKDKKELVSSMKFEGVTLSYLEDGEYRSFKPDFHGVGAAYHIFGVIQACLMSRQGL